MRALSCWEEERPCSWLHLSGPAGRAGALVAWALLLGQPGWGGVYRDMLGGGARAVCARAQSGAERYMS